jgi:hypothetical protein
MDTQTEYCSTKTCFKCEHTPIRKHKKATKCNPTKHLCLPCRKLICEKGEPCGKVCGINRNGVWRSFCYICSSVKRDWEKYLRGLEKKEQEKAKKRLCPSLLELCCKMAAREPQALLFLSQAGLPDSVWKLIDSYIPRALGKYYKNDLVESRKEGGIAMYQAIAQSFAPYLKLTPEESYVQTPDGSYQKV